MKPTSWKLWKMILPLHFGMIFRFQLLVFLEVSNFSGSQHQTLWWYQIYYTYGLEQIEKKKSTKTQFLTSKTSFQLFAPPKLRTFFVSPPKKNTENLQNSRGCFSLSRLCGGKLHVSNNPLGQFVLLGSFLHPFFLRGKVFCGVSMISEYTFLEWFVERLFFSKYVFNQRCPRVQNHSATWVANRGASRNRRCCGWEVSEGLAGV